MLKNSFPFTENSLFRLEETHQIETCSDFKASVTTTLLCNYCVYTKISLSSKEKLAPL